MYLYIAPLLKIYTHFSSSCSTGARRFLSYFKIRSTSHQNMKRWIAYGLYQNHIQFSHMQNIQVVSFSRLAYRFKIRQKCAFSGRFLCGLYLFFSVDLTLNLKR